MELENLKNDLHFILLVKSLKINLDYLDKIEKLKKEIKKKNRKIKNQRNEINNLHQNLIEKDLFDF